jgi:hypothetical protein
MVTNYSFWNLKDPRYQFEVEINNLWVKIKQLGSPPGNPFIYFPSVFAMWVSPKTTWKTRLDRRIDLLMNTDPNLKKFKGSVAWIL